MSLIKNYRLQTIFGILNIHDNKSGTQNGPDLATTVWLSKSIFRLTWSTNEGETYEKGRYWTIINHPVSRQWSCSKPVNVNGRYAQRKFVTDANNTQTVTNVLGKTQTYTFGKVDSQGNYAIEPDYSKMPAGTLMANLARTVHLPTNKSCLRCHATADGGDWTKRGDMGLNSANPTIDQDVHLSQNGAKLTCVDCHSALNHKIGGRGLRPIKNT